MSILNLLIAEMFGNKSAKLNGTNLFCNEYSTPSQYMSIINLFGKEGKPIVRIPVQGNTIQPFLQASRMANQAGIDVIACLDSYESDSSMLSRLSAIRSSASFIKYIELFNELPKMGDSYPGEKITSIKQLLDITNKYSDWVHTNIAGGKVITMATYNLLDERSDGWNITNTEITKQLILYTVADICAIHLYGDSFGKKLQLSDLADNIGKWNDEAKYKKTIWVTELGDENWGNHVAYYNGMVKLIMNLIDPEKMIWYRQCVKSNNLQDNGFALEIIDTGQKSPLYSDLIS
jgi:hypothetical protein